jgi:hypothetical protein
VVADWRAAFDKHPSKAREAVQSLIDGRLTLKPMREENCEFYEFEGTGTVEPILAGVLLPHNLASPTGLNSTLCSTFPSMDLPICALPEAA